MRRLLATSGAIALAAVMLFPAVASSWVTVHEDDHQGQPFSGDCEPPNTLMSENDHWITIRDGTLDAGDSLTFTHPRPTCETQTWPGRLAWKWTGKGQPPSVQMTLTAPDGQTWTQGGLQNVYVIKPDQPIVHAGRVYDVITQKQGKPTYVHMCLFEGPTTGRWTFTVTNIGTSSARMRVGVMVRFFEFSHEGCVTDNPTYATTGYWWPTQMSQWGM